MERRDKQREREVLKALKEQVMNDLKVKLPSKEEYHGNIKAKDAGAMGGPIGGEMVRRLIEHYKQSFKKDDVVH